MPKLRPSHIALILTAQTLLAQTTLFQDSFTTPGPKPDQTRWTTETGPQSYLGRTQLNDWVTPGGIGVFTITADGAHLTLSTYNPTGFSLYGTHAKTLITFQPAPGETIIFTTRLRLTTLQRGLVFAPYLYGCPTPQTCATRHDELDIELLTNYLQPGMSPMVQITNYADEPLGAGNGQLVPLPLSFEPLAAHDWTVRWSLTKVDYLVDNVLLFSTTSHVPQGPMQANIIAWGPASDWAAAYDAGLQPTARPAENQQFTALVTAVPVMRDASVWGGAFSINNAYGADFQPGQPWTLRISGAAPNAPFALCATKDYSNAVCAPGFGTTDPNGNWTASGTFDASVAGGWTEWPQFASGATSNRIAFTVGQPIQGQFRLNGLPGGTYSTGQPWTLTMKGAPPNASFDICAEFAGQLLACTTNFGTTDATGSWTASDVFVPYAVGGWTEWLRLPGGPTNRISFTVIP